MKRAHWPHSLDGGVLLRERPAQCLNAIRDALEVILLLASHFINDRVIVCIAPLDVECVEIHLYVQAVYVFERMRRKATKLAYEGEKLPDVIPVQFRINWILECGVELTGEHRPSSPMNSRCRCSLCVGYWRRDFSRQ